MRQSVPFAKEYSMYTSEKLESLVLLFWYVLLLRNDEKRNGLL